MKPLSQWVDNWSQSAPRATTNYTAGVQNPERSWAQATTNAIPSMVAGFNQAANEGRISQGIQRAGDQYWQSQALKKAGNFSSGLSTGKDNYAAAAAKVQQALQSGIAGLNPRGATGSEENYARSRALGVYLHDRKGTLGAR